MMHPGHYCIKKGRTFTVVTPETKDVLKTVKFTTLEQCRMDCEATDNCSAFVAWSDTNLCTLKSNTHGIEKGNSNAIAARMSCFEATEAGSHVTRHK